MGKTVNVFGRIRNVTEDNIVVTADAVKDEQQNMTQQEINKGLSKSIGEVKEGFGGVQEAAEHAAEDASKAKVAAKAAEGSAEQAAASAASATQKAASVDDALQQIISGGVGEIPAATVAQVVKNTSDIAEANGKLSELEEKVPTTEESGFYITDKEGNIIACINADGEIDAAMVSEHFVDVLKSKGISGNSDNVKQTTEEGFFVTDTFGNVVLKYDNNGLDTASLSQNITRKLSSISKSCISNPLGETAAENPCAVIDTNGYNTGTMYVSYTSSPKDVGESFDACKLAVTSVQNFNMVEHYVVKERDASYSKGHSTDIVNGIVIQTAEKNIRVFYKIGTTSGTRQVYYKDFNVDSKTFGEETAVMLKGSSSATAVNLNGSNLKAIYDADGMGSHIGGAEYPLMTGNVVKKDGYHYTTINNEGYAMLCKSSDNGATWEKVSYIPQYSQYESSLVELNGVFYVLLRNGAPYNGASGAAKTQNNLWMSADGGATWQSSGINIDMGNSRPYMIKMMGKLYIAVNNNNQQSGWSVARPWRCEVSLYEVNLQDKKLELKRHYKDRLGLVELSLAAYNDRMFLLYSNGGLFPNGESAFGGYAQGKDTLYVSEIDNDFNFITNP